MHYILFSLLINLSSMTQITRVNINDYTASTRRTIMLWHRATVNGSTPHCSALTFSLKYSELFSVAFRSCFPLWRWNVSYHLLVLKTAHGWLASCFSDVHSPNFSTKRSRTSFKGAGSRPTETALFPQTTCKAKRRSVMDVVCLSLCFWVYGNE